jgi:hypothetical protein
MSKNLPRVGQEVAQSISGHDSRRTAIAPCPVVPILYTYGCIFSRRSRRAVGDGP